MELCVDSAYAMFGLTSTTVKVASSTSYSLGSLIGCMSARGAGSESGVRRRVSAHSRFGRFDLCSTDR